MLKSHKIALVVVTLIALGTIVIYFSKQNANKEHLSQEKEQLVLRTAAQQTTATATESDDIRLKVLESSQQLGRPVKLPSTTLTASTLAEQVQTTKQQQQQVSSSNQPEQATSIEVRTLAQTKATSPTTLQTLPKLILTSTNSILTSTDSQATQTISSADVVVSSSSSRDTIPMQVATNPQENEISDGTGLSSSTTTTTRYITHQTSQQQPETSQAGSGQLMSTNKVTLNDLEPSESWKAFTLNYGRSYPTQEEELKRREIFLENERFVKAHNAETNRTFSLALNHFADLTRDEINQMFVGPQTYWQETLNQLQVPVPEPITIISLPEQSISTGGEEASGESGVGANVLAVDWRNVTANEVIDQGLCRESSVYAAVASIEAVMNSAQMSSGFTTPFKLSERQVLDCMALAASPGLPPFCQGHSSMLQVFDVLQHKTPGNLISPTEYQEAYERLNGQMAELCSVPYDWRAGHAKLASFNLIHRDNIPDALLNSGPLAVALDASQSTFHFYKEGLYHDDKCSTDTYNHHALLVGYFSGGSQELSSNPNSYYILRNTFGPRWGESGYMRLLKHDTNKCLPQNLAISPNLKLMKEK